MVLDLSSPSVMASWSCPPDVKENACRADWSILAWPACVFIAWPLCSVWYDWRTTGTGCFYWLVLSTVGGDITVCVGVLTQSDLTVTCAQSHISVGTDLYYSIVLEL